jgi:uncharacterized protein (TIGR02996 family)
MNQQALLNEIRAKPDQDGPRLVYADWLTDHGDPRGEFIQIQCRLPRAAPDDPHRPALVAREAELLAAHEATWRAELLSVPGFEWGPFTRGFVETMRWVGPQDQDLDENVLALAQQQPWNLHALNAALIEGNGPSHDAHGLALAYLPMSDWPRLAAHALDVFERKPKNRPAETTLDEASRQCPQALHPHLDRIFALGRKQYRQGRLSGFCRSCWPWHGSGTLHKDFLLDRIRRGKVKEEVSLAWSCALATRDDEVLRLALEQAPAVYRRCANPKSVDQEEWLAFYLWADGLTMEEKQVRRLHGEEGWYLLFEEGYLDSGLRGHPTWRDLSNRTPAMRFGGAGSGKCGFCRRRLHHLITLDPVPADIGVSGKRPLSLEVCLSCLGWEVDALFYRYDQSGVPRSRGELRPVVPQFPVGPLKQTQVRLGRAGPRWAWQSRGNVGENNLHRLGGPPAWVQAADYPACPECGRTMAFLLQLDSDLPMKEREWGWSWGSGGIGYGFWCDRCRVSGWQWQCT